MIYLPTKEELKELSFTKKRDTGIYEIKIDKDTFVLFDFEIERDHKFYAIQGDDEILLDFEDKEEVLLYIKTLKWLKKS